MCLCTTLNNKILSDPPQEICISPGIVALLPGNAALPPGIGSCLSHLVSQESDLGSQVSLLGSCLSHLGYRLSHPGSQIFFYLGNGKPKSCISLESCGTFIKILSLLLKQPKTMLTKSLEDRQNGMVKRFVKLNRTCIHIKLWCAALFAVVELYYNRHTLPVVSSLNSILC